MFIVFGIVLLYLIVLSFKLLARFNLKKKQEDNLDKLNKINYQTQKTFRQKTQKNSDFISKEKEKNYNINILISKSTLKNLDIDNNDNNKNFDENINSIKDKKCFNKFKH